MSETTTAAQPLPTPPPSDCPFCEIIAGRAPAEIFHEWDAEPRHRGAPPSDPEGARGRCWARPAHQRDHNEACGAVGG
jgi:hypothetical protein